MFASFALLARLDALTHSMLNTLKRCTGILFSMVVIQTPLQSHHYEGLAITTAGFLVYLTGTKYKPVIYARNKAVAAAVLVASMALILSVSTIFVKQLMDRISLSKPTIVIGHADDIIETTLKPGLVPNSTSKGTNYVVQTIDDYDTFRRDVNFTSYDQGIRYDPGNEHNVGNLVWQYGAFVSLPDFANVVLCRSDEDDIKKCAEHLELAADAKLIQYRAQANSIAAAEAGRFSKAYDLLESDLDGMLVVGLGVQAPLQRNWSSAGFHPGWEVNYRVADFSVPNITAKFFKRVAEMGSAVLFRGDFSYGVAKQSGSDPGHSVGCPSLWINEDVHMGRSLEKRYMAVASRVGDRSLKVAVNLKRLPGYERQVAYFRDHYPNARFYAQCSWDMSMLKAMNVSFERVRYFTNVEDWMNDLREMDVSYGLRIHGNMIALAVGLPVLVIAPDYRVLDLVERMKVAHTTVYDRVFDTDEYDVAAIVSRQKFDGEEFDRNRCEIAKVYISVFGKYDIGVKPHVRKVAALC